MGLIYFLKDKSDFILEYVCRVFGLVNISKSVILYLGKKTTSAASMNR